MSGEADASFHGAISKFARSEERARHDEWHQESLWEQSDEGMRARESDNFASYRYNKEDLNKELHQLEQFQNWLGEDSFAYDVINKRVLEAKKRFQRNQRLHGPFMVWADQVSKGEWEKSKIVISKIRQKSLEFEIQLGELKRRVSRGREEIDELERRLSEIHEI
ncbi:hypothetical protein ATL17_1261 [Maritalea mobilis]|uniref:Uncharacterized protein n=1 Tax=Maritalea mobilis TaxID=483324 RepID=A0A4R6VWV9_9HYPH|nr:hypothetical protein [Maritalea mobilis]TDQ67254.1 hypothetical protein ATL17_1261 [Maritalea mobilis]